MSEVYDLYILSLKHDAEIARQLAGSLRSYRLPSRVMLSDPGLDFRRIFVDADETAPDAVARERLQNCRFLALLCSPGMRGNPNLMAKLDFFRGTHQGVGIIPVLVEGEPTDVFPASFYQQKLVRQILPDLSIVERLDVIEPVAADLRPAADSRSRRREKLRYETVRIAALLLDLRPDELQQRHRQRRKRAVAAAVAVVAAVSLTAAGIFLHLGLIARNEGLIAEEQARLSAEIARRTVEELPAEFAGNDMALAFVEEAAENTRSELERLGLSDLLTSESGG